MRGFHIAFGGIAALLLAACGGGGGGGGTGGGGPSVAGRIVSRDGSTVDLAGVVVECVESGESDVSGGDGTFGVDAPQGETFRLKFDDPAAVKGVFGGDCTEGGDDEADEQDLDGDEVEIGPLGDGEVCDIEVTIEDGEVVCVCVSKHDDDGEEKSGEARLFPPEGAAGFGEIEAEIEEGCSEIEVEVGALAPETVYDVLLTREGVSETIGQITTNAEGEGHLEIESCKGDPPLPFGVESVAELEGLTLHVTAGGVIVLEGVFPKVGSEDHHDGDDKDDDDGKKGEALLVPPGDGVGFGIVETEVEEGCSDLEVRVRMLAPETTYDVVLLREGVMEAIGQITTDVKGEGEFEIESCGGVPPLPFGVGSVADLAGSTIQVMTGADVVLQGIVPTAGDDDDGDDGKDGDGGDDGDVKDD